MKISKTDYYKLIGLRHLATMKNKELEDLALAVSEITGEKLDDSNYGHASDFIYSEMTVESLLKKLDVEVSYGTKKHI